MVTGGEVSKDETEIIHTFWIQNPNPAGVDLGDAVTLTYQATINNIQLAQGQVSDISIQNGNNTIGVTTRLSSDQIAPWWVNFIQNNETLTYDLRSEAEVEAGLGYQTELPRQQGQALANKTPIESALDEAASGMEGRYACTVGGTEDDACLRAQPTVPTGEVNDGKTAGIEIVDESAEWGAVTQEQTTVLFHFRIRNVGDLPIVANARHLGASTTLNDVELLRVTRQNHSVRGLNDDVVIRSGETKAVTYVVTMDNSQVDEWFTSHVRRDEMSSVRIQLQLVFRIESIDQSLRVPDEGGVQYTCEFQTGILVDNQNSSTTCADGGSLSVSPVDVGLDEADSNSEASDSSMSTPTSTAIATATKTPSDQETDPVADISSSRTSGTAPLTVTFDASGSAHPDGSIQEFVWRFDDGSPPESGETVEHTFRTAGTYEVQVTVIDGDRNRDTATVTINVDQPL